MDLLQAIDLGKRYGSGDSAFYALRHANICFPSKGLVGIKGKSGSGKSTLLNLLARLEKPTEGDVRIMGKPLGKMNAKEMAKLRTAVIGVIFQHYNLISSMSGIDNVALPLQIGGYSPLKARKEAKAILKRFGLEEIGERNVDVLSGGEKQRVAICRCLVRKPRIIFADEPTGALDEKNSKLVMDMLKLASKDSLVVLVSHNDALINEYTDALISVKDGTASWERYPKSENRIEEFEPVHVRHGGGWTSRFTRRNIKRNAFKDMICFLSGVVGFAAILVSVGYIFGSKEAISEQRQKTLSYLMATISEKDYIELPNSPLKLVAQTRPSYLQATDCLSSLSSVTIENDYSYFFPAYSGFELDGEKQSAAAFSPIYDITMKEWGKTLLAKGEAPKQNDLLECVVNEEFEKEFGDDCLGKTISFDLMRPVNMEETKDEVYVSFQAKITGVVHELSFMNSPRVYYSYLGLSALLSRTYLANYSAAVGVETSVASFVSSLPPNHFIANYRYLIFCHQSKDVEPLFSLADSLPEEGAISIESESRAITESFASLSNAFTISLLLFVGIAIVGTVLILAMSSFSSFVSRKKEAAILSTLGAKGDDLKRIFLEESMAMGLFAGIGACFVAPIATDFLNKVLQTEFDIENAVRIPWLSWLGVPFFLVIVLLAFALLVSYLASAIPLSAMKKISLAKELKDE